MKNNNPIKISLSRAALISGLGLLAMTLTVPFAEFKILPAIINYNQPLETLRVIKSNPFTFNVAIFLIFITIICDIIVSWSLYLFLKPVSKHLSLITALFRLIYTGIYLIAVTNLIKVYTLIKSQSLLDVSTDEQIAGTILFHIKSYKYEWFFGLILFGIYLIMLGYLVYKANYIPKVFGWLLVIAGIGYIIGHLKVFLYPDVNTSFSMFTAMGELIFMLWLLIKGSRISQPNTEN